MVLAAVVTLTGACAPPPAGPQPPEAKAEAPAPPAQPAPPPLQTEPAPGALRHVKLAAGAPITEDGIYFLRVATGEVEGWFLPGAPSHELGYQVSPDNRWVLVSGMKHPPYVLDRSTGTVHRVTTEGVRPLAAQGRHLLMEDSRGVWVLNERLEPLRYFAGRPGLAVLSDDGATAIVEHRGSVTWVEIATGATRTLPAEEERLLRATGVLRSPAGTNRFPALTVNRLSPDGQLYVQEGAYKDIIPEVVVAGAAALTERYRIRGASLCLVGKTPWLPDSSAVVISTADGYRLFHRDGQILPLPGAKAKWDLSIPAPDRPDLFALNRTKVVDGTGRVLQAAVLENRSAWSGDPWGQSSTEMRIWARSWGKDGLCTPQQLPPKVERPPLMQEVYLEVGLPPGDCANLRAGPGLNERILTCLPGGTAGLRLLGANGAPGYTEQWWLLVQTQAGQQGWVDGLAGRLTWAP